MLPCGHSFCTICVNDALTKSNQCPTCKAPACPKDVARMYVKEEWLEAFTNFEAFVSRCPTLNIDMQEAVSEDEEGTQNKENLTQHGREAEKDQIDDARAHILVPASPKRALETPQDGPIGKYTTKRKVTDTYADEEEYDGLDNFYDMHDDSLRPRLTPSERGCFVSTTTHLPGIPLREDLVPVLASHTLVEVPLGGRIEEERVQGESQMALGDRRGGETVEGTNVKTIPSMKCSPVETSSGSISACEYMERMQTLGSSIKHTLQSGGDEGDIITSPCSSDATASMIESPSIPGADTVSNSPVCSVWVCSSATSAFRDALQKAYSRGLVSLATKALDGSLRKRKVVTVFAVPSKMHDGLRCSRLTRDLAMALALGDMVVDIDWVQSVLEGVQEHRASDIIESLRNKLYLVTGVVSGEELVPIGNQVPRDPNTGRSDLLAGLEVTLEGKDPQAIFTQDDVAFLLYCSGADVLGVACDFSSRNSDFNVNASPEESLERESDSSMGEMLAPSQRNRLKLCLGRGQTQCNSRAFFDEEEEEDEEGEDLRWLIRTLILQNPRHSS